jgi:hypothetical protein
VWGTFVVRGSSCGVPVVLAWFDGSWCGMSVVLSVILYWAWFG